jgi:hypothetical protein
MELDKTTGYDSWRRDGAKVLRKTLLAADHKMIDGNIQRDLDQLIRSFPKWSA